VPVSIKCRRAPGGKLGERGGAPEALVP